MFLGSPLKHCASKLMWQNRSFVWDCCWPLVKGLILNEKAPKKVRYFGAQCALFPSSAHNQVQHAKKTKR